jgi:large subunit ribosomal protein L32
LQKTVFFVRFIEYILILVTFEMAVPKQRHTSSRRDKRRMHIHLEEPTLTHCPKCGKFVLPHTACSNCGYYKGREVVSVLDKLEKKERKRREKEIKAEEKKEKTTSDKKKPLSWKELSRK